MTTTVRFAPSPTGYLHVGNARMALVNWLFAKSTGGTFILRLDDTDSERSKPEYADAIIRDLKWLGLEWQTTERQSDRLGSYEQAFEKLKAAGRVYPCYETAEELDYMRKRLRGRGQPPIYTPPDEVKLKSYADEGRTPHWRFRLEGEEIEFTDLVRGPVRFEVKHLSDPVIRREDGTWLYMLPSAVDDIDMNITHVVRGEDHVANTALQAQMFEAVGATVPAFAHLPLLSDMEGGGLSKRTGSLSLADLGNQGVEPLALASYLARLGTSDDIELAPDMAALAAGFDFSHFSRGTPKFDMAKLWGLNAQLLHATPFATVRPRLDEMGLSDANEEFWLIIRENVEKLADVHKWHDVCFGEIASAFDDADADFIKDASELLPTGTLGPESWGEWTAAIKEKTGRKGKALFMPLRLALSGLDHGPELKSLLPLIGREKALKRLSGQKG